MKIYIQLKYNHICIQTIHESTDDGLIWKYTLYNTGKTIKLIFTYTSVCHILKQICKG